MYHKVYNGADLTLSQDEQGVFAINDLMSGTRILVDYDDYEDFTAIVSYIKKAWKKKP